MRLLHTCLPLAPLRTRRQYTYRAINQALPNRPNQKRSHAAMEIERKFLITAPPADYRTFPFHQIEQAYLCTEPVVRIRREDTSFYLTYKSKGRLSREEYNLPLNEDAYAHLLTKADGNILTKKRYLLPVTGRPDLTIEFDVFEGAFSGLILAEVEFSSEEDALAFTPPAWFGREVTYSGEYQNSRLSRMEPAAFHSEEALPS